MVTDNRPAGLRLGERVSLRVTADGGATDLIGFVTALDPLTLTDRHGLPHVVPDGAVAAGRRVGVARGRNPEHTPRDLLDELAGRAGVTGEPRLHRISDLLAGCEPPPAVFDARGSWTDGRHRARVEGEWLTTDATDAELLVDLAWWAARQDARSLQVRSPSPDGS